MNININNIEDKELKTLLERLGSTSGTERTEAREALVKKGKVTLDFLRELLSHPKHIYRWEAVKTMEEIGDPDSIPVFIQALEDDKSDVRWIAARGLIKMGMKSVVPLLKSLLEKTDSVFILEGAHHVIFDLREEEVLPDNFPADELLKLLKNPDWRESSKPFVFEILHTLE